MPQASKTSKQIRKLKRERSLLKKALLGAHAQHAQTRAFIGRLVQERNRLHAQVEELRGSVDDAAQSLAEKKKIDVGVGDHEGEPILLVQDEGAPDMWQGYPVILAQEQENTNTDAEQ